MKFGICSKLDNLEFIYDLGYQYIEPKLSDVAAMSDEELVTARKNLDKYPALLCQHPQAGQQAPDAV